MKKIITLLFPFILLNCSNKRNDLNFENLKGKVKSMRINNLGKLSNDIIVREQEELSYSNSLKEYNKKGFIISEKEFLNHDKLTTERKYNYRNKLISEIIQIDYYEDTLKSFETFFYNKKDSIIKKIFKNKDEKLTVLFERNKQNFLTEVIYIKNGKTNSRIKYLLDSNNNKISESYIEKNQVVKTIEKTYDEENRITGESILDKYSYGVNPYIIQYSFHNNEKKSKSYLEGSKDTIYRKEIYNYKGNLIKIEEHNKNELFPIRKIQIWKENKDLIEYKRIDERNKKNDSHRYQYKYDSNGNWIEVERYFNNHSNEKIKRHIEYY